MSVLQPLQETTLELRHGCAEFEQALASLFCDIDQMRLELTDQMQAVEREREQLRFREAELGQHHQDSRGEVQIFQDELEKRDLQLAKARDDLQAARDELTRQREREAAGAAAPTADLTGQLHTLQASLDEMRCESRALQRERDALQERANQSAAQLSRIADLEQELMDVRQQLEQAQTQCREANAVRHPQRNDEADALTLTALAQEREALESELELVRSRAADLNETVTQQQRDIAVQQNELGTELQQLRKLVEKQADLIADRAVNVRENVPPVASLPTVQTQPNDPVVNSVMAQFAKLQKDVAQRRRRKA